MMQAPKLGFRPLYQQVRDAFVQRLVEGKWTPGQALPSEMELAAEVGVSQGTVRKALDALASENLVIRRQGRGTFVAEHDEARILFQFFKLVPDRGESRFPESRIVHVADGVAGRAGVVWARAAGPADTAKRRPRARAARPVPRKGRRVRIMGCMLARRLS